MNAPVAKMSSLRRPVQNPIESAVKRAALWFGAFGLATVGACRGEAPPQSPAVMAEPATPASNDTTQNANKAAPTPTEVRPRPPRPPARIPTPAEPLVEHSGDLAGPISYIVAETSTAAASSPLIVLLHGRGDHPERFVALAHRIAAHLPAPVRFIVARAPLPFGLGQGRQWFDATEASPEASLAQRLSDMDGLLERLKSTYPSAPLPVLVGFSQGGMMALHMAHARPSAIAGAASLSGAFVAAIGAKPASPARPPVFIAAGDRDQVVPAARSHEAAEQLESKGFPVKRLTFAGGHRIPDEVVRDLGTWLGDLLKPAP